MLRYQIYKNAFKLFHIVFFLPLFLCHTVADEIDSIVDISSSSFRYKRSDNKPITIDAMAQTSSPPVLEGNATSDPGNKTLPQLMPRLNSTLSLPGWMYTIKSGALERTGFVVLGFMSIIIVFFIVRGIRLRHKKSKSRKYGVITSTEMEMEPLDNDEDDEEDTTLFDAQHKYSLP